MPADRGLRQLHDAADFGNGELLPFKEQQDAAPRGVRQRGEVVENCGSSIHPLNRMKGYIGSPLGRKPQAKVVPRQSVMTNLHFGLTTKRLTTDDSRIPAPG